MEDIQWVKNLTVFNTVCLISYIISTIVHAWIRER